MEIDDKVDHLTIVKMSKENNKRSRTYFCRCDCGNEVEKTYGQLFKPTKKYKCCGIEGCEYLGRLNPDYDSEYFRKKNEEWKRGNKESKYNQRRGKELKEQEFRNQILTMAWR